MKSKIIAGQVYNCLTAIQPTKKRSSNGSVMWKTKCSCGKKVLVAAAYLNNGQVKSCGHLKIEAIIATGKANKTHGASHGPDGKSTGEWLYKQWESMRQRVRNPSSNDYETYGAKGVPIYKKWMTDYAAYKKYVLSLPDAPPIKLLESKGGGKRSIFSINQIKNKKGYTPGNISWATQKEQARNRTDTLWVKHPVTKINVCFATLCEEYGVKYKTTHLKFRRYQRNGLTEKQAIQRIFSN